MVDKLILKQILQNSREEIEQYKIIHRDIQTDGFNCYIFVGVRRAGKSFILYEKIQQMLSEGHTWDEILYLNFEDERLGSLDINDMDSILECHMEMGGVAKPALFLDEIQDVDGWYLFVNRLLRTDLKVFVTGSNAKLLSGELATHLTGRYNEIRLFPFSFSEYCSFHHVDTSGLTTKADAERKTAFFSYINNGGFPEMQNLRNKRGYVEGLIEAILQKDIQKRFKIRNVEALRKIAHYVIDNSCHEVNFDELSKVFNLSDKTIQKYLSYLQQAFLVQVLNKHSFKSMERIRNTKSYIVDPGLQNNRENSMAAENIGWRLENVVYIELLRKCANEFLDVYYYKPGPKDREVDFVVCEKSRALELIQVAYDIDSPKTFKRETSALIAASDALQCKNLTLVAFAETRDVEIEGKVIHVKSALDWLLTEKETND